MRVELILARNTDAAARAEVETIDLGERDLTPGIGEMISHRRLEYDVTEVAWDHDEGLFSVGAWYCQAV